MKNLKKLCEYFAVAFPIVLVCGFIGLVIKEVQSRENNLMLFLTKPLMATPHQEFIGKILQHQFLLLL